MMIKGHAQKRLMSILVVGKKSKQFCFESVEQHKHKNRWPFEVFGRDYCNKWFSCASYNFHSTTIWYQSHKRQRGQLTFSSSQFVSPDHYGMKINNNVTTFLFMLEITDSKEVCENFYPREKIFKCVIRLKYLKTNSKSVGRTLSVL